MSVRARCRGIRRLVIYLDNGPKNSGVTRKFLRRIVEFADWSGLEIRLVYYPPYHSKYNRGTLCDSLVNGLDLNYWPDLVSVQVKERPARRVSG